MAKDIPQITKFEFPIQKVLSIIYEFSWDKLMANDKDISISFK